MPSCSDNPERRKLRTADRRMSCGSVPVAPIFFVAALKLSRKNLIGRPLDPRVALLEENLKRLRKELDAKEKKFMENLNTVRGVLEEERRSRETEARRLSNQLEEFAVGGLHLEIIGLVWLFLGVLGTSIPDETAALWQAFSA